MAPSVAATEASAEFTPLMADDFLLEGAWIGAGMNLEIEGTG